jgi:hypothetical protein
MVVAFHRMDYTMIHIAPAIIIRITGLRHHPRHLHHQQWEGTVEKG